MSRAYLLAVLDRALKTAAQSAVLVIGADQVNAITVAWVEVGGFAAGGFALSVLTSLASTGLGRDKSSPSLTTERIPISGNVISKGSGNGVYIPTDEPGQHRRAD